MKHSSNILATLQRCCNIAEIFIHRNKIVPVLRSYIINDFISVISVQYLYSIIINDIVGIFILCRCTCIIIYDKKITIMNCY